MRRVVPIPHLEDLAVPPAPARGFTPADTVLLLLLASMWGCSFLFIELALDGLAPLWIVAARTVVGATVLLVVLKLLRRQLPRDLRMWRHLLVLGVLSNAVPWTAIAWAQQEIPSGLAAVLMAMTPTSTLAVSALVRIERVGPARAIGLLLALAGVSLVVATDLEDTGRLLAIAAVVASTLLYACGAVYAKRYVSGINAPLVIAAGQVLTAALVSLGVAAVFEPVPTLAALTPTVVAAVVALGLFGTGLAFLAYYALIERVGATNATTVTYLIPVVGVVAGAVVLGERLGLVVIAGGVCIGAGIWLAQRGTRPSPRSQLEELHT